MRVADEPADTLVSAAPQIAPRPAPERSPVAAEAQAGTPAAAGTEGAPPLAKTGTTVFSVAFAALMVPAGIVLLMAIGGAAWLLAVRAPLGALRRAWPWRRRD
jgi:hypothetical protein